MGKRNKGVINDPRLIDIEQVRQRFVGGASARHVLRLAESGLMPWGVKLGALRRWRCDELEAWVRGGCLPVTSGNRSRTGGKQP